MYWQTKHQPKTDEIREHIIWDHVGCQTWRVFGSGFILQKKQWLDMWLRWEGNMKTIQLGDICVLVLCFKFVFVILQKVTLWQNSNATRPCRPWRWPSPPSPFAGGPWPRKSHGKTRSGPGCVRGGGKFWKVEDFVSFGRWWDSVATWNPNDLYFWRSMTPKQVPFQSKQGSFGFQVYKGLFLDGGDWMENRWMDGWSESSRFFLEVGWG